MSIRFQRTPLIVALLLMAAAGALFYFVGPYAALFSAGGGMLMLAISMLAGGKSTAEPVDAVTEDDLVPTAAFGPAASAPPAAGPLTRAEKRAAKKAEREAKKRAAEEAKFEKKAQAEAAKAEKVAAAEAKKAEKVAAAEAKKAEKAEKKGRKERAADEDAASEEWISELQQMNAQQHAAGASPFGLAVEEGIAPTSEESPRVVSFDDTTDIPVIPVTPAPAPSGPTLADLAAAHMPPPPVAAEVEDSPADWALDAYRDNTFAPPFAEPAAEAVETAVEVEAFVADDEPHAEEAEIVEEDHDTTDLGMPTAPVPFDESIFDLPAEVDAVYADDTIETSNPASSLKRMADRFQDVAAEISREWEHMAQVYEQRDQLLAALKQATAENAALKAEMTKAIEAGSAEEVEALNSSLEEARAEVSRLYEETRELSRLRYASSQTASRLREVRFLIASDPHHDPNLLAALDEAIRDSE